MAIYRQKPIEIQAEQWFSGNCLGVKSFDSNIVDAMQVCTVCDHLKMDHGLIQTLMGPRIICPGDWIINNFGNLDKCNPDIFKKTYELVDDEENKNHT